MIAVLCGGVGAARFLRALRLVADPADVVGDRQHRRRHRAARPVDLARPRHVTYTLAGAIDPGARLGAGRRDVGGDGGLERYAAVRPDGSTAAPTWFNLGDRDLATHFYRTARLAEGATLADGDRRDRRARGGCPSGCCR